MYVFKVVVTTLDIIFILLIAYANAWKNKETTIAVFLYMVLMVMNVVSIWR